MQGIYGALSDAKHSPSPRLKCVTAACVIQQQLPPGEWVSNNFFLDPVPLSNTALSYNPYKSAVATYAIKNGEWAAGIPLHDLSFTCHCPPQLAEPLYLGPSALTGKGMVVLEEESENQCINKRYSLRRLSNKQLGENLKHQDTKVTEIFFIAWVAKRIQLEIASIYCILPCQG